MEQKKQPSNKQLKIGQQIRFLVSSFFLKEDFVFDNLNGKNITIVDVSISPDLKNAKIYVTTNSNIENNLLINELNKKTNYIKYKISSNLNTKFVPKFKFCYDNSLEYSEKINNILKKMK